MPQNLTVWLGFFIVLLLAIGIALVLTLGQPGSGPSGLVEDGLPGDVAGWRAAEPVAHYDTESIYDYIDGHAEVYLAYGMKRSLARRYGGPAGEGDIVLDLFELASPEDAFGVFTHDLDGVPVGVGADSRLRYGWLSFWQGPWFVSVSSEMESDRASQAVLELGRAVAQLLPVEGAVPPVVEALPAAGLDAQSVRFLRHPQILNTHLWIGEGNLFELSSETAATLGSYRREGQSAHLLLVDYASGRVAERVREAFAARFLGGAAGGGVVGGGAVELDDQGWYAARRAETRLAAVLGADSRQLAESLMAESLGGSQ